MGDFLARIRAITSNRWAMAGVAGAAGLGAYTLLRRGGAGPAAASAPVADGDAAGAVQTGNSQFPNTYATDLAAAVGDLDSRYADSLAEFTSQLGTDIDALQAMQSKQGKQVADVAKSVNALKKTSRAPSKTTGKAGNKPRPKKPTQSTAKRGWHTITIRRGDTLGAIARREGTSVSALVKANNIRNPNIIVAGHKLRVPG